MKTNQTMKTMLVAALLCLTTVVNAQIEGNKIYMGVRVPKMTTEERSKIGVEIETNKTHARGQLIFNTNENKLQYWNGVTWVTLEESEDAVEVTSTDGTVRVTKVGSKFDLSVNVKQIADSLANHITNTILGDSILKYITNNINNTTIKLGDSILNYITNNLPPKFGDTILNYITNNFPPALGDTILNYITNNVSQELTDSIMSKVEVKGKDGIEIEGSGTSTITVKLPEAQKDEQILTWDQTNSVWKPADQKPVVKQVTINVENGSFDTKNLTFYGTTSKATGTLSVVAIEPVFENTTMRRNFLSVDATVEVVDNAAEWTVNIEKLKWMPSNTNTLKSVVISYICEDKAALTNNSQGIIEMVGY
jgi:hypothetical protein